MKPLTFALIGHPVAHSLSPTMHGAAYAALGLPHRYILLDCPTEQDVRAVVERLRSGELAGANVTLPWKRLALELADERAPAAAEVGAANVLSYRDGRIVANNTDVLALVAEWGPLLAGVAKPTVLVLGSGGAALAAAAAARRLGAELLVTARSFEAQSDAEAAQPSSKTAPFERFGAHCLPWTQSDSAAGALARRWGALSLIVQSTSAGMHGADAGDSVRDVVAWGALSDAAVAYEIVYNPAVTPFLQAATRRGLRCRGGLGMLAGQAVAAISEWLGTAPPLEVLERAAAARLSGAE